MAHVISLSDYAHPVAAEGFVARLRRAWAELRDYLAVYDELNRLSDRELADIGLARVNVRDVAREAVHGA